MQPVARMSIETATLYAGAFPVTSTSTVQARAFRAGRTPSAATAAVLTIAQGTLATPTATPAGGIYPPSVAVSEHYTVDDAPPSVRVETFPTAVGGWHSGPVTVTFVCTDVVGLASCPGPTTVTAEGETVVSGTATDVAGNQTPASVTVRVDALAPAVALTSPTADLTTTDASVTLTGTVSDAGSGLGLVQCNGVAATVDQGVAAARCRCGPDGTRWCCWRGTRRGT